MTEDVDFKQTEIGRIPKKWELIKFREVFSYIKGKKPAELIDEYKGNYLPYLSTEYLRENKATKFARISEDVISINKGDLILLWDGSNAGEFFIGKEGILSSTMVKLQLKKENINSVFVFYLLKIKEYYLSGLTRGTGVPHVDKNVLENLTLLLPPLPEQQKIAEILSTVDSAIEKVNQAIEKTQRLKKGLMQELLTKGIGHKEFKDTEIGRIPKEWEVVRLGEVAQVKGGKRLPKGHKLVDYKTPYPYIRVVDFKNMSIDTKNIKYLLPETHSMIHRYTISSNDVYISIAGTVGLVGLVPEQLDSANLTENAAKLCNLKNVSKEFLAYVLSSSKIQNQIRSLAGKAQQPKLALFRIEKIKLPLPPLPEQQKIAEILSTVDKRLELLRAKKEKLERIKKGLMNDLLTGRRRIRIC